MFATKVENKISDSYYYHQNVDKSRKWYESERKSKEKD